MCIFQQPGWKTLEIKRILIGILTLSAFTAPVRAALTPPGADVQLTWTSLGSGTTYYVQTSSDLSTWTALTNTVATSVSLNFGANTTCMFRLQASNVPPQSVTLASNPSTPANAVAGYYIYYGESTGNYTELIDAGLCTTVVVSNLLAGVSYYFAITGYTSSGLESELSTGIVWQCPLLLTIRQLP